MSKFFSENLPWKIVALVIATLLWLFVINTQNPLQPQEISGIQIQITGDDVLSEKEYELTNQKEILEQNFKVVVSGPRLEVDKLVRDPSLITATLNLTDYMNDLVQDSISDNANYHVRINLDGSNIIVKDKRPQVTKVRIDKIASKEQKITYELAEDITSHYTLLGDGQPIIEPEKIKITGAKSDIDRVAEAKVNINAKDFSEDQLVSQLPIKLYDVDGEEITGVELSSETAEVKLPIGSQKVVPIHINYTGKMPEGYILTKVEAAVNNVTIVGKADVLASISEIELEPIDLTSLVESNLIQVKMILPNGVMSLEDDKISVSLQVSEENTLTYPIAMNELDLSVQGLGTGLTYEILTDSVDVELSGLSDDLILANKSDIKASLDLTNYTEGEYTLPLTIIPPERIKVKNSPISIKVSIKALAEEKPTDAVDKDEAIVDKPSVEEEEVISNNNSNNNNSSNNNVNNNSNNNSSNNSKQEQVAEN